MPDTKQLLRETRDRIPPPPDVLGRLERLRRHRENMKRAAAAAVAIVVALVGLGGWFLLERDAAPRPGDPSEELGIFAPVAGRIVYENEGIDLGYDPGLWAVDPSGPSDTTEGRSVADHVTSTLVQLDLKDAVPLGWSSDGTELLFTRGHGHIAESLHILHADGSETRLTEEPMYNLHAAISPDGTRVAFVATGPFGTDGLNVVDAEGGLPVRLPYPSADGEPVGALTFSPDGTQIAYLANDGDGVWVTNADGTDAHQILANEATRNAFRWFSGMQWSPAGDRIAIGVGGDPAIYTFGPDGSDFTKVITGGIRPYWSPDGSQIAYTIPCDEHPNDWCPEGSPRRSLFDPQPGEDPAGLAIADADGSNVRAFGFAASGPWHPGTGAPSER